MPSLCDPERCLSCPVQQRAGAVFRRILLASILLAAAPCAPAAGEPENAVMKSSGMDQTFLDFLNEVEVETTSVMAATRGLPRFDGVATPTESAPIPDWLSGPATGTVAGIPLPLTIEDVVHLALQYNFNLQSSRLDVEIADSLYTQERFEFVPFVDLISGVRYTDTKTGIRTGSGLEKTRESDANIGVRVAQNLPTGGDIAIENMVNRVRVKDSVRVETVDPVTGRVTDVSHDTIVTREYQNALDVTARQPLLRGGGLAVGLAPLRLARLDTIDTYLNDSIRRRDVVLSTVRQYFGILQRQLDAQVSLDAIVEKDRFLSETRLKVELGEIAETEIDRAEITLLNEEERSERLKRAFLDSLDGLLVLIGLPLETPLRLDVMIPEIVDLSEIGLQDPEMCVREALANRPEIVRSDIAVRQAEISVQLARNGVLPFLDLEAAYADAEGGLHVRDVNDLDDSRRWSVGAFFDLPFPNKANREALRRARFRLEQVQIARRSLDRNITEEVRTLYRGLRSNQIRVDVLERTVALAERNLEQVNTRFYEGEGATIVDIREAQDDLFQNRTTYNNARLQYYADLASMYRAIGRQLFHEPPQQGLPDMALD